MSAGTTKRAAGPPRAAATAPPLPDHSPNSASHRGVKDTAAAPDRPGPRDELPPLCAFARPGGVVRLPSRSGANTGLDRRRTVPPGAAVRKFPPHVFFPSGRSAGNGSSPRTAFGSRRRRRMPRTSAPRSMSLGHPSSRCRRLPAHPCHQPSSLCSDRQVSTPTRARKPRPSSRASTGDRPIRRTLKGFDRTKRNQHFACISPRAWRRCSDLGCGPQRSPRGGRADHVWRRSRASDTNSRDGGIRMR